MTPETFYRVAALPLGAPVVDAVDPSKRGTLVRRAARLWVDRDSHPPMVRWHGKVDAETVPWSQIKEES